MPGEGRYPETQARPSPAIGPCRGRASCTP